MGQDILDYFSPKNNIIGLISVPHAGEWIPHQFKKWLTTDKKILMQDADYRVHHLLDISLLNQEGIGVIVSHVARVCVDLNRCAESSVLHWKKNTLGEEVVIKKIDKNQENRIIEGFYRPYFDYLKSKISSGSAIVPLIDLHSMPSIATSYHLSKNPNQSKERPDICLSDLNGKTCPKQVMESFSREFKKLGYNTSINYPYTGGHITQFIGEFNNANIQMEINRSLYMDEKNKTLKKSLGKLKKDITYLCLWFFKRFI